jgi:hypothetical protein
LRYKEVKLSPKLTTELELVFENGCSEPTLFVDLLHTVLSKYGQKIIVNYKAKEISKTKNFNVFVFLTQLSGCRKLSVSPTCI